MTAQEQCVKHNFVALLIFSHDLIRTLCNIWGAKVLFNKIQGWKKNSTKLRDNTKLQKDNTNLEKNNTKLRK